MAWPTASARTRDWGSEILTDSELEGQLDILHTYINAILNGTTGHDHSGSDGYGKKIPLTTSVVGTLPATNGGTGKSSFAIGDIPYASATDTLSLLGYSSAGQALITNGVGANPSYAGMTTAGDIEYHDGTTRQRLAIGTSGKVLKSDGTSPTWATLIGTPVVKDIAVIYQADSDGFVSYCGDLDSGEQVVLYTDSSASPSTMRQQLTYNGSSTMRGNIFFPIKKNDYYQVAGVAGSVTTIYYCFIPLGA